MKNLTQMSLAAVACAWILSTPAYAETPKQIDVPAGDLVAALESLSRQADVNLVYQARQMQGLRTQGVSGTLTPREAVVKLIQGTSLRLSTDAVTGAMMISSRTAPITRTSADRVREDAMPLRLAQSDAAESPAGETKDEARIQEIVVTATKRAENIRDVPMSLSVVTAEDVDRRGLVSAEDYLRGIPGVNQVGAGGGYGGQLIVIRGMETSLAGQNYFSGPTTATYFGEAPTTNSAGMGGGSSIDLKLVDIERVEVLRGPQGTAFGSSSLGGTVRTIPVAPKLDRSEARVGAGFSSTSGSGGDNHSLEAVGNLPLIADRLAIRAAAYKFSDSGYYRNRAGSDAAYRDAFIVPNGLQSFAIDESEAGSYRVTGGRIAALFQATENLRLTLTHLTQKNRMDGFPLATSSGFDQTLIQVAPENERRGESAGVTDFDINISNALLEYDLGWADLLGTFSYIDGKSDTSYPFGVSGLFGNTLPFAASSARTYDRTERAAEIRLATRLEGPWNFLAGLYSEKQYDDQFADFYYHGNDTNNFLGARFWGDYLDQRDLKQNAAFGEGSWRFLPRWTLTAGVRHYDYERVIRVMPQGIFGSVDTRDESDASGQTYRGNLSYKANDNTLLYAGWAQGFRLGKPQPAAPSGLCDTDSDGIIDDTAFPIESSGRLNSDDVNSYELGGKFAVLDRRLIVDAAIFRMDWTDIPVSRLLPCGWNYLANVGRARSEGVEFQASLRLTRAWRLDFGGSWIDARIVEDVPAQGFRVGDPLPSPKTNANVGLQYEFNLAGHEAFIRADSIYVGSFYGSVLRSENTLAGDYVKADLTTRMTFDRLHVDLYAHNLTNEDAFTYRGSSNYGESYGYRLRPRTFGVGLGYRF